MRSCHASGSWFGASWLAVCLIALIGYSAHAQPSTAPPSSAPSAPPSTGSGTGTTSFPPPSYEPHLSSSTVTLPGTGTLNRVDASRYGGATTAGGGTLPFSIEQAKKLLEIERSVLSSLVGQLRTSHALDETDPELAEELGLVEKPSEGAAKDARPIEKPKLSDAARSKLLERLHKLRPSTKETPTGVLKQPTDLSASEMAQRHMLAQSLGRVRDLRRWIADQQQISDPSSTFIDFSSPLKIETSSTGRRAGQIGLMTIENRSLTPYHLYIDPSIIPARSLYTGYVVPSPIDISVLPGENASVPIIGYSLDRRRPAVPSDRPLPGFIVDEQPPPSSFSKRLKQTPADATSKFSFVGLLPGTRVPIVKVVENKNGDSKETGPKGLLRRAEMGWERRDLILDAASRVVQTCDAPEFGSDWELPAIPNRIRIRVRRTSGRPGWLRRVSGHAVPIPFRRAAANPSVPFPLNRHSYSRRL